MSARYIVGDTRDVTATMPDNSVDLICTSPPFLALRSYLPADHPDKWREIGSEATPAAFIDMLLELTAEWARVLTPHGSICVELGDTYSGSGGAGGDYNANGLREDQPKWDSPSLRQRSATTAEHPNGQASGAATIAPSGSPRSSQESRQGIDAKNRGNTSRGTGAGGGWPQAKSKALIPELYRIALAYGINPLTGQPSPAGQWRVRNVVTWCRPNPPVGALGDKYRPATSDMVIACKSDKRWFDLDAVRTVTPTSHETRTVTAKNSNPSRGGTDTGNVGKLIEPNPAGAPPLDYWVIPPTGYSGKTTSTRRVPCGPDDGGERTTSPDCPVHAGLPGQLPKALRDARAGRSSDHTSHTDDRHAPSPLSVGDTSGSTNGHSGSSPSQTWEQMDLVGALAANPHDTESNRTGHAPSSSQPCTPSAQTAADTARTSASPASIGQHHGTPESSTSPVDSDEHPSARTTDGTADSPACSCSFTRVITESTSHYAVYPPELCRIPILSMCPRHVCRVCGEPRRRMTQVDGLHGKDILAIHGDNERGSGLHGKRPSMPDITRTTLGWSDCGHGDNWRKGIVFDPFVGSGTTLMVATGNDRDAIGIDLDARNADLAVERLGMFVTIEHHETEGAA